MVCYKVRRIGKVRVREKFGVVRKVTKKSGTTRA